MNNRLVIIHTALSLLEANNWDKDKALNVAKMMLDSASYEEHKEREHWRSVSVEIARIHSENINKSNNGKKKQ